VAEVQPKASPTSSLRDEVLQALRRHAPELQHQGVEHLVLFGSVARGEADEVSDIDLAAALAPDHSLSLLDFARIERELSEELGRKVDFVSLGALKPPIRRRVDREGILAF
jgi:predicted nucleotidyltransferase